jgi:hypothetical protein
VLWEVPKISRFQTAVFRQKDIIVLRGHGMVKTMKTIDVLMVILLMIFVGSLVGLIIYGQVWRINLSMTDTQIESFDPVATRNAFILSVVSIASGGSMLYMLVARFPQEEEKKEVAAPSNAKE